MDGSHNAIYPTLPPNAYLIVRNLPIANRINKNKVNIFWNVWTIIIIICIFNTGTRKGRFPIFGIAFYYSLWKLKHQQCFNDSTKHAIITNIWGINHDCRFKGFGNRKNAFFCQWKNEIKRFLCHALHGRGRSQILAMSRKNT